MRFRSFDSSGVFRAVARKVSFTAVGERLNMSSRNTPTPPGSAGFLILLIMMVSILALANLAFVPALYGIGLDFDIKDSNRVQLVIYSLFLGYAIGQILIGPLSDSYGRKPVIYVSSVLVISGCLASYAADSFLLMLWGRIFQGAGAAGLRVTAFAVVRDCYAGPAMARAMSIVMSALMIILIIAPLVGQLIIMISGWKLILVFLLAVTVLTLISLVIWLPETLPIASRSPFSFRYIISVVREICSHRTVTGYTFASGMVFGGFLGFVSSSQQIFLSVFNIDSLFSLYFGMTVFAVCVASLLNAKLVIQAGMVLLVACALIGIVAFSVIFLLYILIIDNSGGTHLWLFMTWLLATVFCLGMLFGNLHTLAMEPLKHIAGFGTSVTGSVSTFISLPLGWIISSSFSGSIVPLITGFAILGFLSLIAMIWVEKG